MVNMLLVFFWIFQRPLILLTIKFARWIKSLWNKRLCPFLVQKLLESEIAICITYYESQSSQLMIKCGIPQGSILGLLPFLIFINDLCILCKSTEPVLLAYDTNLFSSGSNAISLQNRVSNDLAIIAEWLRVNKLSLNINKTHYMCF